MSSNDGMPMTPPPKPETESNDLFVEEKTDISTDEKDTHVEPVTRTEKQTTILCTCPPMLSGISRGEWKEFFIEKKIKVECVETKQTLTEEELVDLISQNNYDGWIVGDDPVNETVIKTCIQNGLKAIVKWGVGTDNIDFDAAEKWGIPIQNTPGMFGKEVADVALGYLINLSRCLSPIDSSVKNGEWYKPVGSSLANKKVAVIGLGDIGLEVCRRCIACGMNVWGFDPVLLKKNKLSRKIWKLNKLINNDNVGKIKIAELSHTIVDADWVIVCAALTPSSHHMINRGLLLKTKPDVGIINVSRGPVVDEESVVQLMNEGHVRYCGLEVFETEPLSLDSPLRNLPHDRCMWGTHNGSNTLEAVDRTTRKAVNILCQML